MAILFLAIVDHRHGTDVFHAWDSDRLKHDLYQYVREWWHERFDDETEDPLPEDQQEAIDSYFNDNEQESYTWQEIELGNMPDLSEMTKAVKELADMAEELIQDRGKRAFDFQVDVVKAHRRIKSARQLIAKKKGKADEEDQPVLQGGDERQGVPCPDPEGG
jgi:ElaB/YqjD/DUF883 family membrane-anchored ribosome-binding protein